MEENENTINPNTNHQVKPVTQTQVKYHKKKLTKVLDNRKQNQRTKKPPLIVDKSTLDFSKIDSTKTKTMSVKLKPGVDVTIKTKTGNISKNLKDKIKEKEGKEEVSSLLDAYV